MIQNKNQKISMILSTVLGLFLIGCASADIELQVKEEFPPKPKNCQLDMFSSTETPMKKFREIAKISYKTGTDAFRERTREAIVDEIRAEACDLGADGLIIKNVMSGSRMNGIIGTGNAIAVKYE